MDSDSTAAEAAREYPHRLELLFVTVSLDIAAPDRAQLDSVKDAMYTFCRDRATCFFGDDIDVAVQVDAGTVKGKVNLWVSVTAIVGFLTQAGEVVKGVEDLGRTARDWGTTVAYELAYRTHCRNISAISFHDGSVYLEALGGTVGCLRMLESYADGHIKPSDSPERLVNLLRLFETHVRELSSFHQLRPLEPDSVRILEKLSNAVRSDRQLNAGVKDDALQRIKDSRMLFRVHH